jgi:hypothetical protein
VAASDVAVEPTSEEELAALDPRRWGSSVSCASPFSSSASTARIVGAYTIVFAGSC